MTPVLDHAWAYQVYGLRALANRAIPGLSSLTRGEAGFGDLQIEFVASREFSAPTGERGRMLHASPGRDACGEPCFTAWRLAGSDGAALCLRWSYDNKTLDFLIAADGRHVRAAWSEEVSCSDVISPLVGPVLGAVLRLRGQACLHASAVAVGDGREAVAVALIGAKFGGKSTLAAALAETGQAVLTDDLAALTDSDGKTWVQPGPTRLRLWPDALAAWPEIAPESLPPVWQDLALDKRYLELAQTPGATRWRYQAEPLPLAAIYYLDEPEPARKAPGVTPVSPGEGLAVLAQSTYVDYLLERAGRARELRFLGRLGEKTPGRRVLRPAGLEALPQTCAAILEDLDGIGRTRPGVSGKR